MKAFIQAVVGIILVCIALFVILKTSSPSSQMDWGTFLGAAIAAIAAIYIESSISRKRALQELTTPFYIDLLKVLEEILRHLSNLDNSTMIPYGSLNRHGLKSSPKEISRQNNELDIQGTKSVEKLFESLDIFNSMIPRIYTLGSKRVIKQTNSTIAVLGFIHYALYQKDQKEPRLSRRKMLWKRDLRNELFDLSQTIRKDIREKTPQSKISASSQRLDIYHNIRFGFDLSESFQRLFTDDFEGTIKKLIDKEQILLENKVYLSWIISKDGRGELVQSREYLESIDYTGVTQLGLFDKPIAYPSD